MTLLAHARGAVARRRPGWSRVALAPLPVLFILTGLLFGATPAQAAGAETNRVAHQSAAARTSTQTFVYYASYGHLDQCYYFGSIGKARGSWASFYCQTVMPEGPTGPGLYTLFVA
jgi:hypothetical protein